VVPIVIPLVTQLGIDPVHFGLVVTLNLPIGQQTPPVASVLNTVLIICTYVLAIPMFLVETLYR